MSLSGSLHPTLQEVIYARSLALGEMYPETSWGWFENRQLSWHSRSFSVVRIEKMVLKFTNGQVISSFHSVVEFFLSVPHSMFASPSPW